MESKHWKNVYLVRLYIFRLSRNFHGKADTINPWAERLLLFDRVKMYIFDLKTVDKKYENNDNE